MRPGRLVEPAHRRQGVPAALAAEQISRRLRHACELETSMYLYLDGDNVRKDKIKNGTISFNEENSPFNWVDLFAAGPGDGHLLDQQLLARRASWATPEKATTEKGERAYEEAVKQLVALRGLLSQRPRDQRTANNA